MLARQLDAASPISLSVMATCTSFSVSATVCAEISGPTSGPVPNAGGAPGVGGCGCCATAVRAATRPLSSPAVAVDRNCLRDLRMREPPTILVRSSELCPDILPQLSNRRFTRAHVSDLLVQPCALSSQLKLWIS